MLSKRMCFGPCDPGWEGRCQWNMEGVHVSPRGIWRVQEGCQEEKTPELKPSLAVSKLERAWRGIWQKVPRGQRRGGEPIASPLRTHLRCSTTSGVSCSRQDWKYWPLTVSASCCQHPECLQRGPAHPPLTPSPQSSLRGTLCHPALLPTFPTC